MMKKLILAIIVFFLFLLFIAVLSLRLLSFTIGIVHKSIYSSIMILLFIFLTIGPLHFTLRQHVTNKQHLSLLLKIIAFTVLGGCILLIPNPYLVCFGCIH
jgi:hypothetical protein